MGYRSRVRLLERTSPSVPYLQRCSRTEQPPLPAVNSRRRRRTENVMLLAPGAPSGGKRLKMGLVACSKSLILLQMINCRVFYSALAKDGPPHARSFRVTCNVLRNESTKPRISQEIKIEEESEGFLSYRIADRRGDHFDHRGDCHPEPAPFAYGGQRSVCSRLHSLDQHG